MGMGGGGGGAIEEAEGGFKDSDLLTLTKAPLKERSQKVSLSFFIEVFWLCEV